MAKFGLAVFRKKTKEQGRRPSMAAQDKRPAFSYYAADKARDGGESLRPRKQGLRSRDSLRRLRMIPTIAALTAIAISIVYSTTLSTTPNVLFAGEASPYYGTAEYQSLMHTLLADSLVNRSKLTINTGRVEKALLAASPELDAAKLVLPVIGRRPTLTLHVRQPALILTTKTNALILDINGRAVAETKSLPSVARDKLLTLQDESGLEIKVGDQALANETVAFVDGARQQLADKKLIISKLILPAVPNELDIHVEAIPYYIKTDVSGDARQQIGAFLALKDSLGSHRPGEYMDVRVEEKVFYK